MHLIIAVFLLAGTALGSPFLIDGIAYYPGAVSESLDTVFASSTGLGTANQFSSYVLVEVNGTGQSAGTELNDAFYLFTDGSGNPITPVNDPGYYQLRINTSPMRPFQPQFDIKNIIVYDLAPSMQVTAPYVPAYSPGHTYSFIIAIAEPSTLYFGVSDGIYADNSGAYSLTITQLAPVAEPWSITLAACGLGLLLVSRCVRAHGSRRQASAVVASQSVGTIAGIHTIGRVRAANAAIAPPSTPLRP